MAELEGMESKRLEYALEYAGKLEDRQKTEAFKIIGYMYAAYVHFGSNLTNLSFVGDVLSTNIFLYIPRGSTCLMVVISNHNISKDGSVFYNFLSFAFLTKGLL